MPTQFEGQSPAVYAKGQTPFPTQYANRNKKNFGNEDLLVKPISEMPRETQALASREGIPGGDPIASLLAAAKGTLGRADTLSAELTASANANPRPWPEPTPTEDSLVERIWDTATLNPAGLGLTGNAATKAQLASLVMPSGMTGAMGLAFKGLTKGAKLAAPVVSRYSKPVTSVIKQGFTKVDDFFKPPVDVRAQGRQKALEALVNFENKLGSEKPSSFFGKMMREIAGEEAGIPSASIEGPRSATRISHLSQLPEEREITAEQLWEHADPLMLDRLAKMLGL